MKTLLFTMSFISIIYCNVYPQSAAEISKKSMDMIDIGNMEMTSTIHIRDGKGNSRSRQITTIRKKFSTVNKTIVRFIAPADVKGTALLVYDYEKQSDDMWIYLPALRKVRRVVSSEKGKNFMGSEFTNADMSKPNFDDFDFKLIGSEILSDVECYKIESKCKTEALAAEYGFYKRISYIDISTTLCYKVEYYNANNILQRIQTIGDYRKQPGGKYFAFNMKMQNMTNGRNTEIIITRLQTDSQLPESVFTPSSLEN